MFIMKMTSRFMQVAQKISGKDSDSIINKVQIIIQQHLHLWLLSRMQKNEDTILKEREIHFRRRMLSLKCSQKLKVVFEI